MTSKQAYILGALAALNDLDLDTEGRSKVAAAVFEKRAMPNPLTLADNTLSSVMNIGGKLVDKSLLMGGLLGAGPLVVGGLGGGLLGHTLGSAPGAEREVEDARLDEVLREQEQAIQALRQAQVKLGG